MRIEAQLEQTCLLATDAHRPISPVTLREREDRNHALIITSIIVYTAVLAFIRSANKRRQWMVAP